MAESWDSRKMRWYFKFFPVYVGTGAAITYIAGDYRELRLKIPLSWRTRNYVGTIYGGSIYSAIDPMYMLLLMKIFGKDYVVWDKAATIKFKKPGTHTLYATFFITEEVLMDIKHQLALHGEVNHTFHLEIVDKEGIVHATVKKLLYLATKGHYKEKQLKRQGRINPTS
ncbi:DUF4442 domain-containing protein [soil metagenome]